jgi:general secretion pathway protein F
MRINFEALARFAFSMATCLASGLGPRKCLELSAGTARNPRLVKAMAVAANGCDHGLPLSDSLESEAGLFPRFFLPVIRAGEMGGRLVESFQLIHDHCQRLNPPLRLLRKAWLYPLACILAGWAIRIGLFLYFGMIGVAWQFFRDAFINTAAVVLAGWALMQMRLMKELVDLLLLQLPFVRETLVRLSVVLFFSSFRLAYEAGGLDVLKVFDLALATVPNAAIRKDFAKARPVLAEGGAFEDAFGEPRLLDDDIKSSIAAGALSGHLGMSLEQITKREIVGVESALQKFNAIIPPLIMYGVAMSIVGTVVMCLAYRGR